MHFDLGVACKTCMVIKFGMHLVVSDQQVKSKVDRKDYAVKILRLPSAEQSNQICKEAKTMKSLQHKNIVRCHTRDKRNLRIVGAPWRFIKNI